MKTRDIDVIVKGFPALAWTVTLDLKIWRKATKKEASQLN